MSLKVSDYFQLALCLAIIGSQLLQQQHLFYPLFIILFLGTHGKLRLNKSDFLLPLSIIFISGFSLLLRDFPVPRIIELLRFFMGSLWVSFLTANSRIKLRYFIYAFIFWCILELVYIQVFNDHPPYLKASLADAGIDVFTRSHIGGGTIRLLGPAINSSITGSYAGVFLVMTYFNPSFIFPHFNNSGANKVKVMLIGILCALILITSGSVTAFFSTLVLVLLKFRSDLGQFLLKLKLSRATIVLIFLLIIFVPASVFLLSQWLVKVNFEYIESIFNLKLDQYSYGVRSLADLFFGIIYSGDLTYGGDFLILSLLLNFGLIISLLLLLIMWHQSCGKRDYFFALVISTLHYGTIFALTGQVLFGALILSSRGGTSKNTNLIENRYGIPMVSGYSDSQ